MGADAKKNCRHCVNETQCYHVNRVCFDGCDPGYEGQKFNQGTWFYTFACTALYFRSPIFIFHISHQLQAYFIKIPIHKHIMLILSFTSKHFFLDTAEKNHSLKNRLIKWARLY